MTIREELELREKKDLLPGACLAAESRGRVREEEPCPVRTCFQREGITNVVCVSTRYFGGILLGAGGLTRAYTRSAKDALDAAGRSVVRPWTEVECRCPYPLFERFKLELAAVEGVEGEHVFDAEITFRALLPQGREDRFAQKIGELSAGAVAPQITGRRYKAVPV